VPLEIVGAGSLHRHLPVVLAGDVVILESDRDLFEADLVLLDRLMGFHDDPQTRFPITIRPVAKSCDTMSQSEPTSCFEILAPWNRPATSTIVVLRTGYEGETSPRRSSVARSFAWSRISGTAITSQRRPFIVGPRV